MEHGDVNVSLWVGGIAFAVRCDSELSLLEISENSYQEFRLPSVDHANIYLTISILPSSPPKNAFSSMLFPDESWRMSAEGVSRLVESPGSGEVGSLWAARWDVPMAHIEVRPGSKSIIKGSNGASSLVSPVRYPLDQILTIYALAPREGIVAHAAGAVIGEGGYLFAGPSGAGKSAISQIIAESSPEIKLLSDDRILVRRIDGSFHMFGTPWAGTAGIAKNCGAPLKGIFFLEKDGVNRAEPIDALTALPRLLKVASIPWFDRDVFPPILQTTEAILKETSQAELRFRPDYGAVEQIMRFAERVAAR